jgi:hypothetical protein
MTTITDRVAGPPLVDAAEKIALAVPSPMLLALPAAGVRELRLDLFRGLALWLIFIDHVSPDVLTWFTIRSYGFSDAAEIFIFISGYTAAFVYGRAMFESGFVVSTARILRRVWQIYAAHILLFMLVVAEVGYIAVALEKPFYAREMEIVDFLNQPGLAMGQALLLRYRPLNMDVLPLYIVLMAFLPLVLQLIKWRADLTLVASVALYIATWQYDLHLTAWPNGFWSFNPFAWQLLFVFGAWCALGGARRMTRFLASPTALWLALAYLLFAFGVTMTWYFPRLVFLMPHWLEQWMYPIDKTDLDVLRFAHFLALAVIALRLVPAGWPGLQSRWLWPMILCGQRSLEIFSIGVALAFTGYFVLTETSAGIALHFVVGIAGILLMSAFAWLLYWYKNYVNKAGPRPRRAGAPSPAAGGDA